MNPEEIKQKTMTMRSGMVRMLRDREYWTAEDIETLKNEYYAGTSINEIAIMLDRSESAVYQKIEQLGLCIRSAVSSRRRNGTAKEGVCLCESCKCDSSVCPRCSGQKVVLEETTCLKNTRKS